MARHSGQSGEALESARSGLAARDRDLAAADAELVELLAGAHTLATEAVHRLDALRADLDAAGRWPTDAPVEGRELAHLLIGKHREIIDVLAGVRTEIDARTVALQQLLERYQLPGIPS